MKKETETAALSATPQRKDSPSEWPTSPPIEDFTKAITGDNPPPPSPAQTRVTPEQQKAQMANAEQIKPILQAIQRHGETAVNNADVGTGGISYLLFGSACTAFSGGSYFYGLLLLVVSVFLAVVKNRLPEGPVAQWLRRGQIIRDITYTFSGKRRS